MVLLVAIQYWVEKKYSKPNIHIFGPFLMVLMESLLPQMMIGAIIEWR